MLNRSDPAYRGKSRMVRWIQAVVAVLATIVFPVHRVIALNCESLKPAAPIDREIKNYFKGEANIVSKTLGSGQLENDYKKVEKDVLSKYPNADNLEIWQAFIYVHCQLLNESSLTDEEKFRKFELLIDKWYQHPPGSTSSRPDKYNPKRLFAPLTAIVTPGQKGHISFNDPRVAMEYSKQAHAVAEGIDGIVKEQRNMSTEGVDPELVVFAIRFRGLLSRASGYLRHLGDLIEWGISYRRSGQTPPPFLYRDSDETFNRYMETANKFYEIADDEAKLKVILLQRYGSF
jgi:hypothetical protein